ncbi:MAG: hypothetical protein HGA23_09805 [Bacteroidales bacterium]|nr:hypothetical protein [Bacteroidales bacterium]
MKAERVLAVDPGREKCGVAVVDRHHGVLRQAVVESARLLAFVEATIRDYDCRTLILGDGTAARQIKMIFSQLLAEQEPLTLASQSFLEKINGPHYTHAN